MAEEHHHKSEVYENSSTILADEGAADEIKDRGLFDFIGKKDEEKPVQEEEVIVTEFEKVHVSESEPKIEEPKEEEKKHGLFQKLHRSDSSSSSSSDEEEVEGEKKKKKKKEKKVEDTSVPVEKCDEVVAVPPPEPAQPEEKKGFLEKIKEKLPGQTKKTEEAPTPAEYSTSTPETYTTPEAEPKEKKGILEKIKEKLPGYHPKTEEDKEKETH